MVTGAGTDTVALTGEAGSEDVVGGADELVVGAVTTALGGTPGLTGTAE